MGRSLLFRLVSLIVHWRNRIDDFEIQIMGKDMAFHPPPASYSVHTDEASKLILPCPTAHLEESQLKQYARPVPETHPESSHRRLVHSQGAAYASSGPLFLEPPQYEPLLFPTQPRMVIGCTPFRRIVSESLVQCQLWHLLYFGPLPWLGSVANPQ